MIRYLLLLVLPIHSLFAQYTGTVYGENKEPLAYASILVKDSHLGTTTNGQGAFALNLPEGRHTVIFRYLGYTPLEKEIVISKARLMEEIQLEVAVIRLQELTIGDQEDPALSIMRKAVALSEFHYKELEKYQFKAYLKGSVKVVNVPKLLEKQMEKQLLKEGQLYVLETITQYGFEQPNKQTEKKLAYRSNLPPNLKDAVNISMGRFGFYSPDNKTSPVTKLGVRNYRFEYLGYLEENGKVINRIQVTPKLKNQGYYEGILEIVDGSWYVHGFDFFTREDNTKSHLKGVFNEKEGIWFPSVYQVAADFSSLGIEVTSNATISIRDLRFTKSSKYSGAKPEVFDDKLFDEAPIAQKKAKPISDVKDVIKELKKADKREFGQEQFVRERISEVDSLANKRDSLFWETERQIPLSKVELEGFRQADSLLKVNADELAKRLKKDSIRIKRHSKFQPTDLLTGTSFTLRKDSSTSLLVESPIKYSRFNAVEGFRIGVPGLRVWHNFHPNHSISLGGQMAYGTGSKRWYYTASLAQNFAFWGWELSLFEEATDFNRFKPVDDVSGSVLALVDNEHFVRLYGLTSQELSVFIRPRVNWKVGVDLSRNTRNSLENSLLKSPIAQGGFQGNFVMHGSGLTSAFDTHTMVLGNLSFLYYPKAFYTKEEGKFKFKAENNDFAALKIQSGFGDWIRADLDWKATYEIRRFKWKSYVNVGSYLGTSPIYFPDMKFFNGNSMTVMSHDFFRDLPYYTTASNQHFAQTFLQGSFQKLAVTQIKPLAKLLTSEYFIANILGTERLWHTEIGYGWSLLGGALGVEVVHSRDNIGLPNRTTFRVVAARKLDF